MSRPRSRDPRRSLNLDQMIVLGILAVGDQLIPAAHGKYAGRYAFVQEDGTLQLDDMCTYATPSGAARVVRDGKATNGWDFWVHVPTRRTLAEMQHNYFAEHPTTRHPSGDAS